MSAIVVAMGLVGGLGFARWDRTTIHAGGPVSIGSGILGQRISVGEHTSLGGTVLINRSTKPAIIENVRILGLTGGFEALDVRTNPLPVLANASPAASLAQRHLIPGSKGRTGSGEPDSGLRLIIGARTSGAGVAKARGVEVTYRVGHRRYRRSHDASMYLCAPEDQFPGNACPGEAEDSFDGVAVDFPATR